VSNSLRRYPRGMIDPPKCSIALTLRDLVAQAYPDPRPLDTAEEFARQNHDDVPALSDEDLVDEMLLARLRRATSSSTSQWLASRIARLSFEVIRREQRQRA
jgi:hypothetical protein